MQDPVRFSEEPAPSAADPEDLPPATGTFLVTYRGAEAVALYRAAGYQIVGAYNDNPDAAHRSGTLLTGAPPAGPTTKRDEERTGHA